MNEYVKNLNRIEFVVTMACTGKCKHCSEGDHANCKEHIGTDVAIKAICDVCSDYEITSLMTFGGEPFDVRAVCFGPDGEVLGGNLYEKDILSILNDYQP